MTVPAIHCEAKKIAYRQSTQGLVVSFVIHPNDMPDALATAPLGQRYMLAMAAIGDDEAPVPPICWRQQDAGTDGENDGEKASHTSAASQRGKERYLESTTMQQALIRAGRLPKDDRFREWLGELWAISIVSEEAAIDYIRDRCCDGGSRRSITTNHSHYERYIALETEYRAATGQMAEVR